MISGAGVMPLSEHEQRILADIEARLRADDPRFADTVATSSMSRHVRSRIRLSVLGFIVGFALLFVGIAVGLIWGVLGFGLMLASAYQGLTLLKRLASTRNAEESGGGGTPAQRFPGGDGRRDGEH